MAERLYRNGQKGGSVEEQFPYSRVSPHLSRREGLSMSVRRSTRPLRVRVGHSGWDAPTTLRSADATVWVTTALVKPEPNSGVIGAGAIVHTQMRSDYAVLGWRSKILARACVLAKRTQPRVHTQAMEEQKGTSISQRKPVPCCCGVGE